jgi:hypothetical protein
MTPLTTRERVQCMHEHRDAGRIPVSDDPWNATIERWQAGLRRYGGSSA